MKRFEFKTLEGKNAYAIREEDSNVWKIYHVKPGEEIEIVPGVILKRTNDEDG